MAQQRARAGTAGASTCARCGGWRCGARRPRSSLLMRRGAWRPIRTPARSALALRASEAATPTRRASRRAACARSPRPKPRPGGWRKPCARSAADRERLARPHRHRLNATSKTSPARSSGRPGCRRRQRSHAPKPAAPAAHRRNAVRRAAAGAAPRGRRAPPRQRRRPQPSAPASRRRRRQVAEPAVRRAEDERRARPRAELGVDIGGAANFDGLRALWNSTQAQPMPLCSRASPAWSRSREQAARSADLRLIVGPLADRRSGGAALRRAVGGAPLLPAGAFEGQQLRAEPTPQPERSRRHRRSAERKPRRSRQPGSAGQPGRSPLSCVVARGRPRHSAPQARCTAGSSSPAPGQTNWLLIVGFLARRRGALSALSRDRIRAGLARLPGRAADLAVHELPAGHRAL